MSILDDLSNGNISNAALSYLPSGSQISSGMQTLGNVLGGFGAGIQGTGTEYLKGLQERNANTALMGAGQDLASGNIDQGQYLKQIAQYSPETYNKIALAQMQNIPAPIKINNTAEALYNQAKILEANGDHVGAKDAIRQANNLAGYARPGMLNTGTYSLPNNQSDVAPQDNNVQIAPAAPAENITVNPQPISSPLPPQPVRQPGQTELQHKTDLAAWKSNPDIVAHLNEQGAAGKDTIKYNNEITSDAKQAINMHQTIAAMQQAQEQFKAGAFAPAQGTLLKWGRALGVPINDNDISKLSNQQVFTKLQNDIIGQAAKAEGGASRLQSAFNAIKASNPSIGMEPESLNSLFNLMDTKAGEVTNEQQSWSAAKKANPKLTAAEFERDYTAQRAAAQEKAGGNLPSYKGNPNTPKESVIEVPGSKASLQAQSAGKVIDYKEFFK